MSINHKVSLLNLTPTLKDPVGNITRYTYDAYGRVGSELTKHNKLTNTTSHYTFNARNQLTQYVQQDENNQTTKTLTCTYDAFNRRVSKTEDNIEQRYLYDGDDIVAILDSSNQVIATITHDESIDTPLSITNANGTFYYHRDHQGSIVALTDTTGQVVESFTYDNHYGTIINHTKTTETNNPYAYTGRELDTDELYYYRARYYDPQIQRFLGEDPIGFEAGDFNWYRYVGGMPVNFIDPYGLMSMRVPTTMIPKPLPKGYKPYVPQRPLPKGKNGEHKPDCDLPHTQLGTRNSKSGKDPYPQTKEWGAKGDRGYDNNTPKNRTDWTSHNRPNHTDPHKHPFNPKTGDGKKTPREPVYYPPGYSKLSFGVQIRYV